MSASFRISVLSLVAGTGLAACAGRQSAPLLPQASIHALPAARQALPFVRPVDLGRRAAAGRVSAVLLLRYNRQADLDRFVANLADAPSPRYLSREEFAQRYAPTAAQERRAIGVLRANGFRIDKRFPNRTTLDVSAAAGDFERFFATEIHDFSQGKYGLRYANVTPIRIPKALDAYVAAVTARSVVVRHPDLVIVPSMPNANDGSQLPDAATNYVKNPGFETGKLKPSWTTCATKPGAAPNASIEKLHPHGGKFDAYAGTFQNQREPQKLMAICQVVTIPNSAKLKFFTWGVSNDKQHVYQFAGIYQTSGQPIEQFWKGNSNDKGWHARTADLSAYAGAKVALLFGVYGLAKHKGKVIGLFVDDVSLSGIVPTPEPAAYPCPTPNPTPSPSYASNDGWGPQSVQDGLCMPVNYGYDGAGQTAGIVIDKEVNASDLSAYLSAFNITRSPSLTTYSLIDGAPAINDDEGEATLDLETIASLAPGANVVVYVTGDLSDIHIEDAYQTALTDGKHVAVVNSSFGGCESPGTGGFDDTSDKLAQQGAAEGVTFSASSGDQGADCYDGQSVYPFGVQGPASSPHFVAVGGTQSTVPFYTSYDICSSASAPPASIVNPQVWSDCVGAGGGGISTEWALPSFQSGLGTSTHRNVPDIALPAVEDSICFSGGSGGGCLTLGGIYFGFGMIWGTSWSSPIYVAMQTEINQACGGPQWGVSTIYNGLKANGYHHFVDVTKGTNIWNNSHAGSAKAYTAANGFDQVSGIGMPLGMFLATDRCNKAAIVRRQR